MDRAIFEKYFSQLNDIRQQGKVKHLLTDIIGLSLLAVISDCCFNRPFDEQSQVRIRLEAANALGMVDAKRFISLIQRE